MQNDFKEQVIKLKTNILRARFNLMFMVILSAVNILSVISGNEPFMPFSISISTFAATMGVKLSNEQNNLVFLYVSLIISVVILCVILFCYFKSKDNPLFFVVSLGVIFVDTLVLIIVSVSGYFFNSSFIVDLIIHIITFVYIFSAIKAHKELGVIDKLSLESITLTETNGDDDDCPIYEDEEINEDGLEKYTDDGTEPIVSGECNDLQVFAVVNDNSATLIVGNRVCDTLDISYTSEFELSAIVNSVEFNFQYKRTYSSETAYLYANNVLLDSFARDFF